MYRVFKVQWLKQFTLTGIQFVLNKMKIYYRLLTSQGKKLAWPIKCIVSFSIKGRGSIIYMGNIVFSTKYILNNHMEVLITLVHI